MIELVIADRCISCMACVRVCPNDVFDIDAAGELPIIARTEDCCTCYLCEAHCPVDAMYVSPLGTHEALDEDRLLADGLVGGYRRALGWDARRPGTAVAGTGARNPFGPPGGPGANHRTESYAPGGVNEGHRHSPYDRIALERWGGVGDRAASESAADA